MKWLVIGALILQGLYSCVSTNRPLHGYYISSDKQYNIYGNDNYFFKGDSFRVVNQVHNTISFGLGTYKIIGDSIVFSYKALSPIKNFEVVRLKASDPSFSRISVEVIDGPERSPMPGVNVLMEGTMMGTVTDSIGTATLSIPRKQMKSGRLQIFFVGYDHILIPIRLDSNNDFSVRAALTYGFFHKTVAETASNRISFGGDTFTLVMDDYPVKFAPTDSVGFRTTYMKYLYRLRRIKEF